MLKSAWLNELTWQEVADFLKGDLPHHFNCPGTIFLPEKGKKYHDNIVENLVKFINWFKKL